MHKLVCAASAAAILVGCAKSADKIAASYISPMMYANYNCEQIQAEAMRVSARAAQATGQQNQKASNDAVAMGVGLVIFWPALFFIKGKDETAGELARLKGEMDAIQQASIEKQCGIEFAPPPAPKQPASTQPRLS